MAYGSGQQPWNQSPWSQPHTTPQSPQGNVPPPAPQWTPYQGGSAAPAWQAPASTTPDTGFDVSAAMDAMMPLLNERFGENMGAAAQMAGNAGALQSTDYVGALGQAQRGRDADLAGMAYDYQFRAAESDAQRRMEAEQARLNRDLSSWGTHGGWGQAGLDRDYDAWARGNQWNMDQWQGMQNQYGQNWNQQMDQWRMMMEMMGMFGDIQP